MAKDPREQQREDAERIPDERPGRLDADEVELDDDDLDLDDDEANEDDPDDEDLEEV